ncbi:unnamed protein product, partial [Boreogadus saida]
MELRPCGPEQSLLEEQGEAGDAPLEEEGDPDGRKRVLLLRAVPEEWDEELSEPELQRPPESEQSEKEETSEKEEPVQSPLLEEGSIEEEPEQREGGEELSEPVLQESSESGQSEEEGPDQSPEQLRRTTRTTAGIHSNPFDLPRSAVRKRRDSTVCGEADPFSYKHKLGQILRRSMSLFSLSIASAPAPHSILHLLSERDRDLELAARIGQSLLQRNNLLQERNEAVEEQLNQAIDQVHQLQHELAKKDELLRMVASASEESESDSSCSTPHPLLQRAPGGGASTGAAATAALGQLEALQGKLEELEEENQALRSEASHLKTETFCYEEKEQRLVNDCVKELRESSSQVVSLADELSQKGEEVLRHQEEIAQLLSQIVELQHRVKEVLPFRLLSSLSLSKSAESHLQASKQAQTQLTAELNELTERNAECLGMLHESQEEVKDLHSKSNPTGGLRRHLSYGLYPMDSLAAEIEGTMRKELSVDEETIFQDQRTSQRRVFQTVRSVNTLTARAAASSSSPIPGSGLSPLVMTAQPFQSAQGGLNPTSRGSCFPPSLWMTIPPAGATPPPPRPPADHLSDASAGSPSGATTSSARVLLTLSELSRPSGAFKSFLPPRAADRQAHGGLLTLHHWQQLGPAPLATLRERRVVTKGFRPLSTTGPRLPTAPTAGRPGGW